jgi:sugar lactone lactonase YvrE
VTVYEARVASGPRHVLAEGPVWNPASGTLIWVDIVRGTVFEGSVGPSSAGGAAIEVLREWQFEGMVGVAVPGPDGALLVAGQDHLVVVAADGRRRDGPIIVRDPATSRTNDGACDPAGRLLLGTIRFDEVAGYDVLVRVDDDGSVRTLDSDLGISNGLAWSPDGRTLYSTDTSAKTIWARDYDPASGAIGERRPQLRLDEHPDGICVDARGYIWAALWGTGEARAFTPDGEVVDVITVPAPHVSSLAFVGPELDRLVITTASRDLDAAGLASYPDAGRLFLADVAVTGVPTFPWSGSWSPTTTPTH